MVLPASIIILLFSQVFFLLFTLLWQFFLSSYNFYPEYYLYFTITDLIYPAAMVFLDIKWNQDNCTDSQTLTLIHPGKLYHFGINLAFILTFHSAMIYLTPQVLSILMGRLLLVISIQLCVSLNMSMLIATWKLKGLSLFFGIVHQKSLCLKQTMALIFNKIPTYCNHYPYIN